MGLITTATVELLEAGALATDLAEVMVSMHRPLTSATTVGHSTSNCQRGQTNLYQDCWEDTVYEDDCRACLVINEGLCRYVNERKRRPGAWNGNTFNPSGMPLTCLFNNVGHGDMPVVTTKLGNSWTGPVCRRVQPTCSHGSC